MCSKARTFEHLLFLIKTELAIDENTMFRVWRWYGAAIETPRCGCEQGPGMRIFSLCTYTACRLVCEDAVPDLPLP